MHGAGATETPTTAELAPFEIEDIAQHPEKRHFRVCSDGKQLAVDAKGIGQGIKAVVAME